MSVLHIQFQIEQERFKISMEFLFPLKVHFVRLVGFNYPNGRKLQDPSQDKQ